MVRLDEMQLQKAIRLSERIGVKLQAECAGTCKKRGRPSADDACSRPTKRIVICKGTSQSGQSW